MKLVGSMGSHEEESFNNLILYKLGNVTKIAFGKSKWIGVDSLANQFLTLFALALNSVEKVTCSVQWGEVMWDWSLQLKDPNAENEVATTDVEEELMKF